MAISSSPTLTEIEAEFNCSGLQDCSTKAGLDPLPTSMLDFVGLSSGWDLSKFSYDGNIDSGLRNLNSIRMKPDGTRIFSTEIDGDLAIHQNVDVAYDILSGLGYQNTVSVPGNPFGIHLSPNGTKMYTVGFSDDIEQWSLSTPWNVGTASDDNKEYDATNDDSVVLGLFFKDDGTRMYLAGNSNSRIWSYTLSTAWDVSTASSDGYADVSSQATDIQDVFISDDGTKMFVLDDSQDAVFQYSLSPAWEVTSTSYSYDNVSLSVAAAPNGMGFADNGTKLYVARSDDLLYQYSSS